jgi:NADPH:quinone reductase-like Zn-dependent oxidoreductase
MKAITCSGYGAPHEVLRFTDVAAPAVGDSEVLVRVRAASVNPADWHLIRGVPYIARLQIGVRRPSFVVPGCDIAGEVEAVGAGVETLRPGDEVFGCPFAHGWGAFAERVAIGEDLVAERPANVSFEQAAAVPLAAMTALQGLRDRGRLESGQRVLIVGASGGVGTFAVQIAHALGAEVTGVCSTRNVELVRSLGAHNVVDYTAEDFTDGRQSYDLVFQVAGSASPSACRRALTRDGTLVSVSGDSRGRWIGPVSRLVGARLLSPFVSQTLTSFTMSSSRQDLETLGELLASGQVQPVIDRTYPLSDVPEALRYLEQGHARGKVVITV